MIDGFSKKYGIKVNSANPNGSSQDELTALTSHVSVTVAERPVLVAPDEPVDAAQP